MGECAVLSPLHENSKTSPPLPCFILSFKEKNHSKSGYCFLNLSDNKFYSLEIPETQQQQYFGASEGWLLGVSPTITLTNPMTGDRIHLPTLSSIRIRKNLVEYYDGTNTWVEKVVFSSSPSSKDNDENCIAMAITMCNNGCNRLIFCKSGDRNWTVVEGDASEKRVYKDITFCSGKFYAVYADGKIVVCSFGSTTTPVLSNINSPRTSAKGGAYHLVESMGVPLLVKRISENKFENFRLDHQKGKWLPMKGLGNRTLFLSSKFSFSLLASSYPGLKKNCIYFISRSGGGIFNLEKGSYKALYANSSNKYELGSETALCITPTQLPHGSEVLKID